MPLHTRILIGLVLGTTAGVVMNITAGNSPALQWVIAQAPSRSAGSG